tara:strand:- start:284 stop:775 length:492 start_codon:yes stop_codon:yes gene_type:complete
MINLLGEEQEIHEEEDFPEQQSGYKLGGWIKSIQKTKIDLMEEENEYEQSKILKSYVPYVINHCLMGHIDTVLMANEMNKMGDLLSKESQFQFLINMIEAKFRPFKQWLKSERHSGIEAIMKYYGYNKQKATEVFPILSDEQLKFIKSEIEKNYDRKYGGGSS